MKKLLSLVIALILSLSVVLVGCGSSDSADKGASDGDKKLKIVFYANGPKGDKSFFDSADAGLKEITKKFGAETKFIEGGVDASKWVPALEDLSEQDWDIIIVGTWQLKEPLEKVAKENPDKKYIIFDAEVDYAKLGLENVYSITYKQNEGSFLAGALAAKVATSSMPNTNDQKVLGFVGGMDSPVINDFLVGYIQGAKHAVSDIRVLSAYVGDFVNIAKGKELALSQFNQKADVVFSVASTAGLGSIEAAKDSKKYVIGVDSDQSLMFAGNDEGKANAILNSVLKRVDNSLVRAIDLELQGKLPWGKGESLGIKEGAIGICDNEYYTKNVPEDIRKYVAELEAKVSSGEIKVESAMGMDTKKLNDIKNSVK
ncbi:MAG: BMP family ABC transporter substrate-binding protein [Clostridium sp.]